MALFGSFETEREVYSDPIYAVYLARKSGDPGGEYAVKVFRLPANDLEAQLTGQPLSREQLEQARRKSVSLQELAATGSRFISPVLERGQDERGVWYATRFYQRSVNKMMSGKVALPRASLEHIISSIAQGALDFKRACGRAHGDLRPTNIQVSKTEKVTEAEVALCDPLAEDQTEPGQYEKSDLHAIGAILFQLVRQRVISTEDLSVLVPIGPSDEWVKMFGSDASDWLALCNRLLDPNLSPERFQLEDLVARLNELKPKRQAPPKLALAGAALMLTIAVAGFWLMRPGGGTVEVTSDPSGATIVVDQSKTYGQTPQRLKLRRGDHVIKARLDAIGLAEEATNCTVQTGKSTRVHFQFAYGSIAIQSDPAGATILRDGAVIGKTGTNGQPFVIAAVAPGNVRYQLKLAQYEPVILSGTLANHQRLGLSATLLRESAAVTPSAGGGGGTLSSLSPREGIVELVSDGVPATIVDGNGRELGRTSADIPLRLSLVPGTYVFSARAEGLDDAPGRLQVQAGTTNQYHFVFAYGVVDWTSQPVPATIVLGQQSSLAPASFFQKPGVAANYVIAAPGYQTTTNVVIVGRGEHKSMTANLVLQVLTLQLASDPPGADFFGADGVALARCETNQLMYYVPWGSTNLVARYSRLGAITNHLELSPGLAASKVLFQFDYGTLVLSNLPPDNSLYEGDVKIGAAADNWVYQKRGTHLYSLRSQGNSDTVLTNINAGLNYLVLTRRAEKTWKNSLGMWFAWVPNLPGGGNWPGHTERGGWVGLTEVTQGEYKKMDGNNPSIYRQGGDSYPVENLTRQEAQSFCLWLSSADTANRWGWKYALPTDAQFVAFAGDADRIARVSNEGRMSTESDELFPTQRVGRIPGAAGVNNVRTHPEPVASTGQSNDFGLYDVVGNVSEWLTGSRPKDNVYAGGSYLNFSARTLGTRAREKTLEKGPNIGFRVVLVP